MAGTDVGLHRQRDPVPVSGDSVGGPAHRGEHFVPLALDRGEHRTQVVVQAGVADHRDGIGDGFGDRLARSQGCDGESQQHVHSLADASPGWGSVRVSHRLSGVDPTSDRDGASAAGEQVSDRILTVPNIISMLRLLLVPVVAVLIFEGRLLLAFALLVAAGLSDWLDGVIARRFHQASKLGRFLDPSADRLFIFVTVVGLAYQDIIPWWLVLTVVAREVAVGATLPVMFRHGYPGYPVH